MFILTFILSRFENWTILYSMVLMMYGVPTFLSGVVMQFTPLKIGGIVCWVLAIVASFIPPMYILLLIALAVVAAWIIPGYMIRKKYTQQNK